MWFVVCNWICVILLCWLGVVVKVISFVIDLFVMGYTYVAS